MVKTLGFFLILTTAISGDLNAARRTNVWPDLRLTEFLKLSIPEIEVRTGYKLKPGEKLSLRLLRSKMKKAARKDPGITVSGFFSGQKNKNAGTAILYILLGAVLLFFVLFLMLYTDSDR